MQFLSFFEQSQVYDDFKAAVDAAFEGCFMVFNSRASCRLGGRSIMLSFRSPGVVYIEFSGRSPGAEESPKDQPYFTAQALMPGTVEGMHRFIEFARQCKTRGWKIEFATEGKRSSIYGRALARAGMQQVAAVGGGEIWG